MFIILWTFIRSFYSPALYDEVSHKTGNSSFNYLFAFYFFLSLIFMGISLVLSFFFVTVAYYFTYPMPSIESNAYFEGTMLYIVVLLTKIVIAIIYSIVAAFIYAICVSVVSYIAAAPGKIFSLLLFDDLKYDSVKRIAAYSYPPATVCFWLLMGWAAYDGILFEWKTWIVMYCGDFSYNFIDLPRFVIVIIFILICFLLPLPIWIVYVIYGVTCCKFYNMKMKRPDKGISKVIR